VDNKILRKQKGTVVPIWTAAAIFGDNNNGEKNFWTA
jgi:hypothetical protein